MYGALVQAGIGVIGEVLRGMKQNEADEIRRQALARFGNISEPALRDVMVDMLPPSEAAQVRSDPRYKQVQEEGLTELKRVSDSGGITLEDQAVLNKSLRLAGQQESAGFERINQQQRARGTANSGNALAMQLANNQASAERAQEAGMQTAGMAQRRAMEAIMGRANQAGQMRNTDFAEQMRGAEAADLRSRYNNDQTNTGRRFNSELEQKRFQNSLNKAQAMSGESTRLAAAGDTAAASTGMMVAGIGAAAGVAGNYLAGQPGAAAPVAAPASSTSRAAQALNATPMAAMPAPSAAAVTAASPYQPSQYSGLMIEEDPNAVDAYGRPVKRRGY